MEKENDRLQRSIKSQFKVEEEEAKEGGATHVKSQTVAENVF